MILKQITSKKVRIIQGNNTAKKATLIMRNRIRVQLKQQDNRKVSDYPYFDRLQIIPDKKTKYAEQVAAKLITEQIISKTVILDIYRPGKKIINR